MNGPFRLADVVGSLSVVTDLGFGLPPQNAMRSSLIATHLGRRLGLDDEELQAAFYVPLLLHIGCISMSHETAALFGNEIAVTRAVAMTNLGDPQDIVATLIPEATRGLSRSAAEERANALLTQAPTFGMRYDSASTEVARATARRIGLPEVMQRGLYESAEAWNGDGFPRGLKGEDIAAAARITRLASDAAFFDQIGGPGLAVDAVRARAGTLHDPGMADVFIAHAADILAVVNSGEPEPLLLDIEPDPVVEIGKQQLLGVAAAVGNAADLKTPYTHGHSGATAETASAAGDRLGLDADALGEVQLAAFLHDVGRVGISNVVWEKAGPLNNAEWEEVRMHAYQAERIVARSERLDGLDRMIGMHHERLDGSGYHRGSRATEIPIGARIIAVADAWVSMQQPRPHRDALDQDRAAAELKAGADDGQYDPQVVTAILASAGLSKSQRPTLPAGLSSREVEVLRLVAAGHSNPEIAARLNISRRTAEHHVQHIYTKIGASTRPGAAMFAIEHDLLEPLGT
jgi:HD-GYP domain-containing protein (c-di-GMP phosphodiesterase class II)